MFGRHLAIPVVRISDVADQRVHLVLLEHIGPVPIGRIYVLRRAFFSITSAYSAERIDAKSIPQSARTRRWVHSG